jgi:hypothetical protein
VVWWWCWCCWLMSVNCRVIDGSDGGDDDSVKWSTMNFDSSTPVGMSE